MSADIFMPHLTRPLAALGIALLVAAQPAFAQKQKDAPVVEELELTTKDGLNLHATYYEAEEPSKEVVPVIMLHDYQGSRGDLASFAEFLQSVGHSVLVPDLRGHGQSTNFLQGNRALTAERLRPADFGAMIVGDLEACKKFLMEQNNQGKVNIEKLSVIGVGLGATLAVGFAGYDWAIPSTPLKKNGQDVKALVLISPEVRNRQVPNNMLIGSVYSNPRFPKAISMHIAYGSQDRDQQRDAERLHKDFALHHWQQPPNAQQNEIVKNKDLFLDPYDTKLQGSKLIGANLGLERRVATFLQLRAVNQDDPWTDRSGL